MKTEFESKITGEVGNLAYVLRNLIQRDWKGKLYLNLKWKKRSI